MKLIDKDTRFYLDIDLISKEIINLEYENKFQLSQHLANPFHRVFISEGQYHKLLEKWDEPSIKPHKKTLKNNETI